MPALSLLTAFCLAFSPAPRSIPFHPLFSGPHVLRDTVPETVVIRNEEEERHFVETHSYAGGFSFPKVDYRKAIVLGVILAPQTTGAIKVEIDRIEDAGKSLQVHSIRWMPKPGRFVTEDIGYPVCFVQIDRLDKPVKFLPTEDRRR